MHRAAAARADSENLAQGVRKETGQALRELQVDHGEAVRQLAAAQEALQRSERKLQVRAQHRCGCDCPQSLAFSLAGVSPLSRPASMDPFWQQQQIAQTRPAGS